MQTFPIKIQRITITTSTVSSHREKKWVPCSVRDLGVTRQVNKGSKTFLHCRLNKQE